MRYFADVCPDARVKVNVCVVGMLANNVFILENPDNPDSCVLVDPSSNAPFLLECLAGRTPDAIVATHYHFDHVGAAAAIREATGSPVLAHRLDADHITGKAAALPGMRASAPCPVDRLLEGGEELELAGVAWKVIHTPGHTPGGICLFAEGTETTHPVLIAGDTLFDGNIGRVDFPDGSMADMRSSLTMLRGLPKDTYVLTGHDSLTTIGQLERTVFSYYLGPR